MGAMSARRLATKTKKTLRSMVGKLIDLECQWDELDEYLRSQVADTADVLKALVSEIDGAYPPRSKRT